MDHTPIAIPLYAAKHVAGLKCRHCRRRLKPADVVGAGVYRSPYYGCAMYVEVMCASCRKTTKSFTPEQRLSPAHWAKQISDSTPDRNRRPKPKDDGFEFETESVARGNGHDDHDGKVDRPEYFCTHRTVLACAAANFDTSTGEPAVTVTLGTRTGAVEPLAVTLEDARLLVCGLLASLAAADDRFAQHLLDGNFPYDTGGNFHWPRSTQS